MNFSAALIEKLPLHSKMVSPFSSKSSNSFFTVLNYEPCDIYCYLKIMKLTANKYKSRGFHGFQSHVSKPLPKRDNKKALY